MSINWVMLKDAPHSYVQLPGEQAVYQSPARTSLQLTPTPASKAFTFNSSTGVVHLTTQRLIYTPTNRTPNFESFSAPIASIVDSRITAPFFGPNAWVAQANPVPGGGLPTGVELKLVFKDGGAFDFHGMFERVKERVLQAREDAVPEEEVHLEDLPAYEDASRAPAVMPQTQPAYEYSVPPDREQPPYEDFSAAAVEVGRPTVGETPSDAPPGYEETQRNSVAQELERQIGRLQT